jgi:hypothetical protein
VQTSSFGTVVTLFGHSAMMAASPKTGTMSLKVERTQIPEDGRYGGAWCYTAVHLLV